MCLIPLGLYFGIYRFQSEASFSFDTLLFGSTGAFGISTLQNPVSVRFHCQPGFWPYRGFRIGEAKNPGPQQSSGTRCQITIGIANPTAVLSKASTFVDFMKCTNAQVLVLAETSATLGVQKRVSGLLSMLRTNSIWSDPVMPLRDTQSERASERGKASGTAVLSTIPFRKSRLPPCPTLEYEPRVVHSIVQLGQTYFQLVGFYGYAHSQCNPKATHSTSKLLAKVLDRIRQIPLPFVICGDFNYDVTMLPCWPLFSNLGAIDLASLYSRLCLGEMPATCHGATRPDNAIVSKDLVPFVTCVRVHGPDWFPVHNPVTFTITLPKPQIYRSKLRLPESWMCYMPQQEQLAAAYVALCPPDEVDSFEQWGQLVDSTVDVWLQTESQHSPNLPSRLAPRFRGRCQSVQVVQQPINSPLRKARNGDFEPTDEILTFSAKRLAKQVRRIQSLLRRLKKDPAPHLGTQAYYRAFVEEWICILKAPLLGSSFAKWICTVPELGFPPMPLPAYDWLFDLLQLVKHQLSISLAADRKIFEQKAKLAETLDDLHKGSQRAFAQVRGAPKSL